MKSKYADEQAQQKKSSTPVRTVAQGLFLFGKKEELNEQNL